LNDLKEILNLHFKFKIIYDMLLEYFHDDDQKHVNKEKIHGHIA